MRISDRIKHERFRCPRCQAIFIGAAARALGPPPMPRQTLRRLSHAFASRFFESHAGKAVVGVSAAVFLLAWPPALPWIAAAALLQFGVRHLALAFKEDGP